MKRIILWFLGVEDVINHRRTLRTFEVMFNPNIHGDQDDALEEVVALARKDGFERKDIIKSNIVEAKPGPPPDSPGQPSRPLQPTV